MKPGSLWVELAGDTTPSALRADLGRALGALGRPVATWVATRPPKHTDEALAELASNGVPAAQDARYTCPGAKLREVVVADGNPRDRYANHLTVTLVAGDVTIVADGVLPLRRVSVEFRGVSLAELDAIKGALATLGGDWDALRNVREAIRRDRAVALRWLLAASAREFAVGVVRKQLLRLHEKLGVEPSPTLLAAPGVPPEERAPPRPKPAPKRRSRPAKPAPPRAVPVAPTCPECSAIITQSVRTSFANEFDVEVTIMTSTCPACGWRREVSRW